jgi:hypothetical protein
MPPSSEAPGRVRAAVLLGALALPGCAELPPDYLSLAPEAPAERALQARRFDGVEEKALLQAAVGVLQDLGFVVETAGSPLGFVQGTKEREAKAPEQMAVLVLLGLFAASRSTGSSVPLEQAREDQTVSVLLSVRPAPEGDARSHLVVVTFHRHLRQPLRHTAGTLREPQLYQSFFELLSKSIFLEAQKL